MARAGRGRPAASPSGSDSGSSSRSRSSSGSDSRSRSRSVSKSFSSSASSPSCSASSASRSPPLKKSPSGVARRGRSPVVAKRASPAPRKASPLLESVVLHVDQLTRNVNEGHLKEIFGLGTGGGRSSARETIGRVAAGAVAKIILRAYAGTEDYRESTYLVSISFSILQGNMKVVAAYLLALLGGKSQPSTTDLKSILGSVGAEANDDKIELLLSQVKGKDTTELIASGREKLASVPSGGGGAAVAVAASAGGGGAPAPAEAKKEETQLLVFSILCTNSTAEQALRIAVATAEADEINKLLLLDAALVIVFATEFLTMKEIPRTALVWALTHVVQPGDCITLLVVVPAISS
ncbi:hypothetical protein IFM89_009670, partial [Coptis chinensis]